MTSSSVVFPLADYLKGAVYSIRAGIEFVYFGIFWVAPILAGESVSIYYAAKEKRIGHPIRQSKVSTTKGVLAAIFTLSAYVLLGGWIFPF